MDIDGDGEKNFGANGNRLRHKIDDDKEELDDEIDLSYVGDGQKNNDDQDTDEFDDDEVFGEVDNDGDDNDGDDNDGDDNDGDDNDGDDNDGDDNDGDDNDGDDNDGDDNDGDDNDGDDNDGDDNDGDDNDGDDSDDPNRDALEILKSNKGGNKLCYKRHMYIRHRFNKNDIRWRCVKHNHKDWKCKGAIKTTLNTSHPIVVEDHNHVCDSELINKYKSMNRMKAKAKSDPSAKPCQIFAEEVHEIPNSTRRRLPAESSVKRTLRNQRLKNVPPEYVLLDELVIEGNSPIEFIYEKNYLLCWVIRNVEIFAYCVTHQEPFISLPLQQWSATQKRIRKTLVFPEESHSSIKMVETAVNQHFAHLHGVLQNVERRMIDKLYDQRNDLTVNLSDIQQRLKTHEDQLQSTLQMAATVNAIIDKINLKDVIVELERLADVPCHLVQDPIVDDEKIVFCPDPSIIEILENHCRIEIPKVSGYNLLPSNTVSTDYEAESLSRQELLNGRDESFCSNTSLMKRASSCQSLCSRRSEARHLREGSTCLVNVCYVQNPSNFYVRQVSYRDQIRKLDQKIGSYAKHSINVPSEVHPNDLYIVKRADKSKWYRGRVNAVNTIAGAPDTYEVFNVDYGLTETQVPRSRMRRIPGDLATTPQMAINCSLYDIVPIDGKWRTPARKLFFDIVKRKPDHAVTLHIISVKGNTYYVDICEEPLMDGQGSQTSVRDALVFLGHGAFVDSQYLRRTCPLSVRKFLCEDLNLETYSYVMCSYVKSPDCIYVQKAGEHLHFLCTLTNDISKYYKHMQYKSKQGSTGHIPEIGQPCAVENSEGQWHRGTISRVPRARMVEVFLVDFGSTITTPYDRIRKLHERFMMYPTQAIKVTLADIKPRDGEWREEAIQFTKRNVEHKYVRVFAFEQTESGYNVAFYVGDEENRKNLSTLLVAGGLAVGTGPRSTGQAEVSINQSSQRSCKAKVRNNRTTKAKKFNSNCYTLTKSAASDVPTADPYKLPVKIVRVVSPDTIYVCDTSLEKEYEQMMMEMQKFYNKYKDVSTKCDWQMNYPCAVYSSRDRCFCRGEITAFKSSDEVQVFLYDLALTETVPISELQALKKKFWITPMYVCKVKLAGILPCGGSSVWPSSSCEKLKDHISENHHAKFYISKVVTPGEDELNVDLWMEEIKIDGPVSPARIELNSISRMLVDTGLALPIKQYNEKKTKVLAIELKRQLSCTDDSSKNDTIDWTANGDFKERRSIIATAVKSTENDESFESSAASSTSDDQSEDATSFLESSTSTEDSFVSSAQTLPSTEPKLVAWLPAEPILDNKFVAVPTNLDQDCCVHLHSKSQSDRVLRFIATTLHDEYSNLKVGPWDLEWEEGEICVAQWHGNKKWYRAQVVRILDNMIEVEFIDYGNVEECENGTLRKRLTLTHIPRQSTKCVISGLVPNTPNGKWRTHDLDKIHNLLVEKECEVSVLKRKPDHLVVSINLLTPTRCELVSYLINEVRMDVQPDFVDPGYSNDETESTIENSCDVIVVGYVKNPVSEAANSESNEENTLGEKEKKIEYNEENILSEKEKTIENNEDENEKTENNDEREKIDEKGEEYKINLNEENENGKTNDFSVIADLSNTVSAPHLKEGLPYVGDCTLSMENVINLNYKSDDVAISGTANFTLSADQIEISQREAMGKLESQSFLDCNSLNEGEIITSTPFNDSLALAPKGYQSLTLPKDVRVVKAEVVLVGLTKAWLHLLDNQTSEIISKLRNLYEKIMQDMQDCANEQPLLKNFEKNTPCCAKFVDNKWYRCKVVECGSDPHELGEMVQVRFVDWGNTDCIRRDEVRTLKDEWFDVPCMAFRCRLWRVVEKPTADSESVRQMKVRQAWRVCKTPPRPVHVEIEGHSRAFYDVQIYTDEECTELIYQSLIDDGLFLIKSTKGD